MSMSPVNGRFMPAIPVVLVFATLDVDPIDNAVKAPTKMITEITAMGRITDRRRIRFI